MGFASKYLKKNRSPWLDESGFPDEPTPLVIVVPCYNEPELLLTLKSILSCEFSGSKVTVVVVINAAAGSPKEVVLENLKTRKELDAFAPRLPEWMNLKVIEANNLPPKHAGAGWARKLGMDWAIAWLEQTHSTDCILVSLDADCRVDRNYLSAIELHFKLNPTHVAATLAFKHSLDNSSTKEAITLYELYMRYYKHAVANTGFPYSIYTIGSAFAVKASAYVAQGGMNRKKAGEDFYFLHKLTPYGPIGQITSTTVYPSSRLSERVPFGTGPVLKKFLSGDQSLKMTYPLAAFDVLKALFQNIQTLFQEDIVLSNLTYNNELKAFIEEQKLDQEVASLKKNCRSASTFRKRFFHVFNAFQIIKWLNFSADHGFLKQDLIQASIELLESKKAGSKAIHFDAGKLLSRFRELDNQQA